jgi:hypothetical protein
MVAIILLKVGYKTIKVIFKFINGDGEENLSRPNFIFNIFKTNGTKFY